MTAAVGILALGLGFVLGFVVFSGSQVSTGSQSFPTGRFENRDAPGHVFEFKADGTYYYEADFFDGDPDVTGVYGVRGDLYTEMTHDYAALPKVPATYRWTYDGTNLTFELVGEDVIQSRQWAMDGQTFVKND